MVSRYSSRTRTARRGTAARSTGARPPRTVRDARPSRPVLPPRMIAGLHAHARSIDDTPWARIAGLYGALIALNDTPLLRLNQAAAVAWSEGPITGLTLIDELETAWSTTPTSTRRVRRCWRGPDSPWRLRRPTTGPSNSPTTTQSGAGWSTAAAAVLTADRRSVRPVEAGHETSQDRRNVDSHQS